MAVPILAAAGISAAGSLLGGLFNRRAARRAERRAEQRQREYMERQNAIADSMQDEIDEFSDPNYFLPMLQRLAGDSTQGNYNINAQLAQSGVDSPLVAQELMEAGDRNRAVSIRQGMDAMEGQRLSMLNNLIGQQAAIRSGGNANMLNAQMNTQNNLMNARMTNTSQMIGGITGAITQGIGAKISQNNFNQMMSQQTQPVGAVNAGQTLGYGQNAYDSALFGNGGFGSSLYG